MSKTKQIKKVTAIASLVLVSGGVLQNAVRADSGTNQEKENAQKVVKQLKASGDVVPSYGVIQWTNETEVKPLSGQKQENYVSPEGTKYELWTVKAGDKFLITNVSTDDSGKKASVIVTYNKIMGEMISVLDSGKKAVGFSDSGEQISQSQDGSKYFSMKHGISFDQTGFQGSDRTYEFVGEDGKTPVKVNGEMGFADVDFRQGLKTDAIQSKDDVLLGNDKWNSYENGVLRSNGNVGIDNIAVEETYTGPNSKTSNYLGYGYAQKKTTWSGSKLNYSFGGNAAVLDNSLLSKVPTIDKEFGVSSNTYGEAVDIMPTEQNIYRDVVFGDIANNIVEVPAPNAPVLAKPKIPEMPTLKGVGYSSPTKQVLDEAGKDVNGQELENDAIFNWLITQDFEFSGTGTEYSDYTAFKQAVENWVKEVDGIKTQWEKDVASFNEDWNTYDKVEYPAYVQKWTTQHEAGAPGEKVEKAKKSDTSDLEIPEAPSTELEDYLIGSFTIKDVIGTTNVNLSDKSEWFVEVSSDGEKYEKLDPKNYTLSEDKQEGKTTVTAEFNKDYVQSDEFYKTSYKRLSIGGQTFNLEGVEANTTISVPNVATSTVNGEDKDTNEVVVSTKTPDKKETPKDTPETPNPTLPHTGAGLGTSILTGFGLIGTGILGFFLGKKKA